MSSRLVVVCLIATSWLADVRAADVVEIGKQRQLLVDDYAIEKVENVRRQLGKVEKANGGKPIFTDGWFYGTVLYDQGRFKLWYRKADHSGYGYAESGDGLHFDKKATLNGVPFAGDINLAVELNRPKDREKFRFIAGFDAPGMAAGVARSADGINWTPLNDGRPVTFRAADCHNQILWDPMAKVYRLFTRTDFGSGGGPLANTVADDFEVRGTRGMTNPDVVAQPNDWSVVRQWYFNREGELEYRRRQIYSMTVWIHESIYFALMAVYEYPGDVSEGRETDQVTRHEHDVMQFYIATSRDADNWDLSWVYAGEPIIPRGPNGSFDKDMVFPSSAIVTHDDKHWLYYGGANERHGTAELKPPVWFESQRAIGLATLPLDRFVGLRADKRPGTIVTKPFRLAGPTLELNVDASDGTVAVDVLDETGSPIEGYCGDDATTCRDIDELRLEPHWRQAPNLAALVGNTVSLRFRVERAALYAFSIR